MSVRPLTLAFTLLASGCILLYDEAQPCVQLVVDDELVAADPSDAFPGLPFDLRWKERYLAEDVESAPQVDSVIESLLLLDPDTREVLVQLDDRVAPGPELSLTPGGRDASVSFADFQAHPDFDPVPRNYLFQVELHLDGAGLSECAPPIDPAVDSAGELPLEMTCTCDGYYSYGLRASDGATDPPSPIILGTMFDLTWTTAFEGSPCAGAAPLESGAFVASVQLTGEMGSTSTQVDIPSMAAGTSIQSVLPISDLLGAARPLGTYTVTVTLDPAGGVPSCTSQGEVDPSALTTSFTFEVVQ